MRLQALPCAHKGTKTKFPKEPSGLGAEPQATPARQRPIARIGKVVPARAEPRPVEDAEARNSVASEAGTWKVNGVVPEDFRLVGHHTGALVDRTTEAFVPFELGQRDARLGVQHDASILDIHRQVVSLGNVVEVGHPIVGKVACARLAVEYHLRHTLGERQFGFLHDDDEGDTPFTLRHLSDFLDKREEGCDSGFVVGE